MEEKTIIVVDIITILILFISSFFVEHIVFKMLFNITCLIWVLVFLYYLLRDKRVSKKR